MQASTDDTFQRLVAMIKEVKPGLADDTIELHHSVIDDLGLDSLDLLQLSRRINRDLSPGFELEIWNEDADTHGRSVRSILDAIAVTADASR